MDKLKKEKTAAKKSAPKTTSDVKTVSQETVKPNESVKSQTAPPPAANQTVTPSILPAAANGSARKSFRNLIICQREKVMEQSTQVQTESSITETMAVVKIEGQEFKLEAVFGAGRTKCSKPCFSRIFRGWKMPTSRGKVKDGQLTVTIVKRAQHKG